METKGGFIRDLIQKVHSAAYSDIEDVLNFVGWLDKELSTLVILQPKFIRGIRKFASVLLIIINHVFISLIIHRLMKELF